MADDGENHGGGTPAWARRGRRSGSNPLVGLLVTLFALFGALTAGLAVKERSVAGAGEQIDGWLAAGWNAVRGVDAECRRLLGQLRGEAEDVADAAGDAAEATGEAAEEAGDAVEAGADAASEELKNG